MGFPPQSPIQMAVPGLQPGMGPSHPRCCTGRGVLYKPHQNRRSEHPLKAPGKRGTSSAQRPFTWRLPRADLQSQEENQSQVDEEGKLGAGNKPHDNMKNGGDIEPFTGGWWWRRSRGWWLMLCWGQSCVCPSARPGGSLSKLGEFRVGFAGWGGWQGDLPKAEGTGDV